VDNIANLAKTFLGAFDPNFACSNFSRIYHEILHKDHKGEWQWDLSKKPLGGFPLYAGWLQMVAEAQRRVGFGLNIQQPVLVLLSSTSMVAKEFVEEARTSDILMNVKIAKDTADKIGKNVKVISLPGAVHDIFLSGEETFLSGCGSGEESRRRGTKNRGSTKGGSGEESRGITNK